MNTTGLFWELEQARAKIYELEAKLAQAQILLKEAGIQPATPAQDDEVAVTEFIAEGNPT